MPRANANNGFAPYNYFVMKKILEDVPEKVNAVPEPPEVHPYAATDPIPVPEARESDSDSAWALWQDLTAPKEKDRDVMPAFANTVPDELPTQPAPLRPKPRD